MATFDSKTIVMMAENGHSVEIDGKKIQLTIVQEAVEAKPDYSHLVGKWVKCVKDTYDDHKKGKWYPLSSTTSPYIIIKNDNYRSVPWNMKVDNVHKYFDISNPLDHNPDEVRVFDVPSEIKIAGGSYGLGLCFSENQTLIYDVNSHCYAVLLKHFYSLQLYSPQKHLPCIATECKFEDLQEGDLFYGTNDDKPDFTWLMQYRFLSNNKRLIWTDGNDVHTVAANPYKHYFKITPKP